jgi:NAD(P)-dependent dehydrogenase (short-subunit alcohol dehydrogenase family)
MIEGTRPSLSLLQGTPPTDPCNKLPHGVRVNAIAPGEISTSILSTGTEAIIECNVLLRRLGEAREVAETIHFLCTEAMSYTTGAEIHINGGLHV